MELLNSLTPMAALIIIFLILGIVAVIALIAVNYSDVEIKKGEGLVIKKSPIEKNAPCNISYVDIKTLMNEYVDIFPDKNEAIQAHIPLNTKEFLEHCINQNHIPIDDETAYDIYLENVFNYVDSHLQRRLGTNKKSSLYAERIIEIIDTIIKRNT